MKKIAITAASLVLFGLAACGERQSASDRANAAEAEINAMVANQVDQTGDNTPLFTEQEKADMANLSNSAAAADTGNGAATANAQ